MKAEKLSRKITALETILDALFSQLDNRKDWKERDFFNNAIITRELDYRRYTGHFYIQNYSKAKSI